MMASVVVPRCLPSTELLTNEHGYSFPFRHAGDIASQYLYCGNSDLYPCQLILSSLDNHFKCHASEQYCG